MPTSSTPSGGKTRSNPTNHYHTTSPSSLAATACCTASDLCSPRCPSAPWPFFCLSQRTADLPIRCPALLTQVRPFSLSVHVSGALRPSFSLPVHLHKASAAAELCLDVRTPEKVSIRRHRRANLTSRSRRKPVTSTVILPSSEVFLVIQFE